MHLQIETSSVCNARCVFCPYPDVKRPHSIMPFPIFERVIDLATDVAVIDQITLTGLGEPLLDTFIYDRLKYIRSTKTFRSCIVDLYTNGHNLTVDMAQRLHDAGLTVLYVSINAVDAAKRKAIVGMDDYQQVVATVQEIHRKVPALRCIAKAVVSKDLFQGDEAEAFKALWGGPFDEGGNAFLHLEGNWAGDTWKSRIPQTGNCWRLFNQIMVLVDGRVSLCCFDAKGEVILGDTRTQTLREILQSPLYEEYRRKHIEGRRPELKLCGCCTAI